MNNGDFYYNCDDNDDDDDDDGDDADDADDDADDGTCGWGFPRMGKEALSRPALQECSAGRDADPSVGFRQAATVGCADGAAHPHLRWGPRLTSSN